MAQYAHDFDPVAVSWNTRDVLLFANSIGCTDLNFLYEDAPGSQPFPTYPLMLSFKHAHASIVPFRQHFDTFINVKVPGVPRLDSTRAVDGGRSLHISKQLPSTSEGRTFKLKTYVEDVSDKGSKGTVVNLKHVLSEHVPGSERPEVYAEMRETVFYVGQGGWGGPKGNPPSKIDIPNSSPTFTHRHQISTQAHLLYRLNGDYNPLHADPHSSSAAAFDGIIMHGLYSWNVTVRVIVEELTQQYQVTRPNTSVTLVDFEGRFLGMVRPGDVLDLQFWVSETHYDEERLQDSKKSRKDVVEVTFAVSVEHQQQSSKGYCLVGKARLDINPPDGVNHESGARVTSKL